MWRLALTVAILMAVGCRERAARDSGEPPSVAVVDNDAAVEPFEYAVPPDAPPPLGLGPYANLHADFVERCPSTLPERPKRGDTRYQEYVDMGATGRDCNVRQRSRFDFFAVQYTDGDPAYYGVRGPTKEEGYQRVTGNVDDIFVDYERLTPRGDMAICQSIPEQLAQLYQHTSGITKDGASRLAATLRAVAKLAPPRTIGRIRLEDRVLYASINLGKPNGDHCNGIVESGLTLGEDPIIVDVPLAAASDTDQGR